MSNKLELLDKKILIAGATGGIGECVARHIACLGARTVLTGRKKDLLDTITAELPGAGHIAIQADFLELEDTRSLFDAATADGVKLDGMIYSAGDFRPFPLRQTTKKRMLAIMDLNWCTFVDMVRNYARKQYSNGGCIIGISSIAAMQPEKGQTLYAATKAAMNASVHAMAFELVERQIRINTIMPGFVDASYTDRETVKRLSERQLFHAVTPEEVAGMCAFLFSNTGRAITGRSLYLDAGRL